MNFLSLSFKEKYNYLLSLINKRLDEILSENKFQELKEPLRYFISNGGKRIRPVLTLISYGVIENSEPTKCIDSAVAIEILHNFTLIHDDIMDKSVLRRGQLTIHKKWNEQTAILLGDIMIGYSYQLLINSSKNLPNFTKILDVFTNALIKVCEGQTLDMLYETKENTTLNDYFKMIELKTAKLLESAVLIGAYHSDPTDEQISALSKFAINLGIGFQIQDDLMDLTAKEEKFGKKVGQDLIDGKKTYVILKALDEITNKDDKKIIIDLVQNKGVSEEKVPLVISILKNNGILDQTQKEAIKFFEEAKSTLNLLPQNEYSLLLEEIVNYLMYRDN